MGFIGVVVLLLRFARGFLRLGGLLTRGLGASFPVTGVYVLDDSPELCKRRSFGVVDQIVLDASGECLVVSITQGSIIPVDEFGESHELHIKFGNFLIVAHLDVTDIVFCFSGGIRRSEIGPEFTDELIPIEHPFFDVGIF